MARKVVGILCSTSLKTDTTPARHYLNRAYVSALENAGATPIILPVTSNLDIANSYLGIVDGILLSGGLDVEPSLYGAAPHPNLGELDTCRDETEMPLIKAALEQDMPLFAICRGLQALNVARGGTLYQDIPSELPSELHHLQSEVGFSRDALTHKVVIDANTRLRSIVGDSDMMTNSFHHQALQKIGDGLLVTAHSTDGIVEAVEDPNCNFLVGVQFHPEETTHDEKSRRLFEAFVGSL